MVNSLEDRLKAIERRQDSLQKTLDLMYADRSLFEDIVSRLGQVENALHLNREHQTEVQKDLKADIQEVQYRTEDKVNEMRQSIDEKTVIIKSPYENIVSKIIKKLKGVK